MYNIFSKTSLTASCNLAFQVHLIVLRIITKEIISLWMNSGYFTCGTDSHFLFKWTVGNDHKEDQTSCWQSIQTLFCASLNTARWRHLLSILAVTVQTDIHPHPSSTASLLCSQGIMAILKLGIYCTFFLTCIILINLTIYALQANSPTEQQWERKKTQLIYFRSMIY